MSGLRLIVVICVACALSACSTRVNLGGMLGESGEQGQQAVRSVAFEPVVGLPDTLSAQFAAELASAAVSNGLRVVSRDDKSAAIRAKGYFSAAPEGSGTRITYVWDLFEKDGDRTARFDSNRQITRTADDPWSVVTVDDLRAIAQWTIAEIAKVPAS